MEKIPSSDNARIDRETQPAWTTHPKGGSERFSSTPNIENVDGSPVWTVKSGQNLYTIAKHPDVIRIFRDAGYEDLTLDKRLDILIQINKKTPLDTNRSGALSPYVIYPGEKIRFPKWIKGALQS